MGYINDTHFSQFISPADFEIAVGTWTVSEASNLIKNVKTAGDEAPTVLIPIKIPSNASALKGAKLKSIDVWYKVATAACDDFATVELEKITLPATGVAVSGTSVTITEDAGHDSAAKRKATGDHTLTVNITTPAWLDDGDAYWLKLVIDAAATTVLTLFGARANFDLRA